MNVEPQTCIYGCLIKNSTLIHINTCDNFSLLSYGKQ